MPLPTLRYEYRQSVRLSLTPPTRELIAEVIARAVARAESPGTVETGLSRELALPVDGRFPVESIETR